MSLPLPPVTLQAARRRAGLAPGVPSPCISVCKMDAARGLCQGCFRTIDEIRAWSKSDAPQRLAIWNALLERAGIAATAP